MKRWMAIDYGEKNIGIALTDSLKMTAQPFTTLHNTRKEHIIASIKKIVVDEEVEKIIVGLPLNMDGSLSSSVPTIETFAGELSKVLSITVEMWDERLTTLEAERVLLEEAHLSPKKRKKLRDKLAACFILKSYMEKHMP